MSEYDKVLAIHDWLCKNISYGQSPDGSDQDIYGALVKKRALCAGYAEAFSYLLSKAQIKSSVISGDAIGNDGIGVSHAWNLVYIDGEPYYFDVTWNDNDPADWEYYWFGITSKEFQRSHFPSSGYEWVDADAVEACYYVKNKMYIEKYTPNNIAKQIQKQGKIFTIKCADRAVLNDVVRAIEDEKEIMKIMRAAGIPAVGRISYGKNENPTCITIHIQ
jgi:hypothetical protein